MFRWQLVATGVVIYLDVEMAVIRFCDVMTRDVKLAVIR